MKRIQRRRTKGWRMPEGAIYVGRPSRWGNPYAMPGTASGRQDGTVYDLSVGILVASREDSIRAFRAVLDTMTDRELSVLVEPLRGHDLACWCPLDQPCHADVLLELANR